MGLFGFGRTAPSGDRRRIVETWARAAGSLGPATVVKVNEIVCPDPACPGYETIILVMAPGRRSRAVKIAKPVEAVEEADVVLAINDLAINDLDQA